MVWLLAVAAAWLALGFRSAQRSLHYFQIEEYDNLRFARWALAHLATLSVRPAAAGAVLLLLTLLARLAPPSALVPPLAAVGWTGAGVALFIAAWRRAVPVKKPLVYTARAKRLLAITVALQLLAPALCLVWVALRPGVSLLVPSLSAVALLGGVVAAVVSLTPFFLPLANIVAYPLEAALRRRFIRSAEAKLRALHPTVIGITGSYGKTSTKDILAELLGTKYQVAKTPRSFNTLLGICRVVNGDDLRPQHEYFVAEVGAYIPGEIARLSRLLRPKIGIITAIGPQHLERFGSLEAVAKAKYELIQALPQDGLAVLNADDERCRQLARTTTHVPVALYGVRAAPLEDLFLSAQDQSLTKEGVEFTLIRPDTGERQRCQTRLLGDHSISNILAAATVALHCGLSLAEIAGAVKRLSPVPHRLELKRGAGGVTILDDAYNSNPIGARNALQVLSMFNGGQRILVTPGFVELGPIEQEENRRLGETAAQACDVAILVGIDRTRPIREGLLQGGFPADNIVSVAALHEGIVQLRARAKPGDTVLLLNDLPDIYELVG